MGTSIEFTLFVTNQHPTAFFGAWQDYAIRHAYLRGQRFYASGELIPFEPSLRLNDVRMPADYPASDRADHPAVS